MKHSARLNSNRLIAMSFVMLGLLLFMSIAAIVILSVTNYKLQGDRQVVTVPMLFRAPFALSENSMDAAYLEQIALSFVALRLNVSPETVDASHQFLLTMVKPAAQKELKLALAREANQIKKNDVNAAFFKTGIRVYPSEGRADIRGELKTWFGDSKPDTALKHYALYIDRSDGVTWLARFVEVSDEKK